MDKNNFQTQFKNLKLTKLKRLLIILLFYFYNMMKIFRVRPLLLKFIKN